MIINIFGSVQNAGTKIAFQVLTYTSLKMTTEIKNRRMQKMKKAIIIALFVTVLTALFAGCSSTPTSSGNSDRTSKQIPDLTGDWKQTNSKSSDSYQAATISGDMIEIYWVSDNGDTKSLYWAGSFIVPTTADEPFTWDSKNDHSKTDSAMLASSDDTKTMTYQNGVLSYEVSAMGTTTKVNLEKQK